MSFLSRIFRRKALQPQQLSGNIFGSFMPQGIVWWTTNDKLMAEGYQSNSTVYSIISKIATKCTEVPGRQYRVKSESKMKELKALRSSYDVHAQHRAKMLLKSSDFEELELPESDKATQLLKNPNSGMSWADFMQFVLINKMVFGGCPVLANKGAVGDQVLAIYPWNPNFVQIEPDQSLTKWVKARLTFFGYTQDLQPELLYIVKYVDPVIKVDGSHLFGFSPLKAAARILQIDNENLKAQGYIFKNKGATGLFVPENLEAANAIGNNQATVDQLKNELDFVLGNRDGNNNIRPYVQALLKYISFGADAQSMELVESQKESKKALCSVYDYPEGLVTGEAATFNNRKEYVKYLVTNTIQPHLRDEEDLVNNWLYPLLGVRDRIYIKDTSAMPEVQEDFAKMAEWLAKTPGFTMNETRAAMNYDDLDIPAMDVPLVASNLVPISDLGMADENLAADMEDDL